MIKRNQNSNLTADGEKGFTQKTFYLLSSQKRNFVYTTFNNGSGLKIGLLLAKSYIFSTLGFSLPKSLTFSEVLVEGFFGSFGTKVDVLVGFRNSFCRLRMSPSKSELPLFSFRGIGFTVAIGFLV